MTVTDVAGLSANATPTVTVLDTIAPVITCPSNAIENADANCQFTLPDYTAGVATDNCVAGLVVTQDPAAATIISGHGTIQIVKLVATDASGNADSCTFTVTLIDVTDPVATSQDTTVYLDGSGSVTIDSSFVNDGSADNCGIATITLSQSTFTCAEVGPNLITMTVTDVAGLSANATPTVTVADSTPPVAACQSYTVQLDAAGTALIDSSNIDNGSSDNCSIATMSLDISSFTCADLGDNTVTMTVSDASGNSSSCQAIVTVEDIEDPVILCPNDTIVTALAGNCSMVVTNIAPGPASDNCSVTPATFRMEGATTGSGSLDVSGTVFNKGLTTVWYKVSDQSGNADSCSFDVTVLTSVVSPDSAYTDRDSVCAGDGNIQLMYGGGVMVGGGTAQWYDDALLSNKIGTDNNLIISAPVVTTTYYLRFEGSCDSSAVVSTIVFVKTGSTAPVSASSDRDNICPGDGSIVLTYMGGTPGTDAIARWYSDSALTAIAGIGNNLSLFAPLVTTPYFVRFEGDCDTTSAVGTLLQVSDVTLDPDTAYTDRDSICSGDGTIILSYIGGGGGSNVEAVWYADSSISVSIGTGNDLSIAAPLVSTTYFVRFEADCDSSNVVGTRLTVGSLSVAPDSAYADRDSICSGDGNIILSYGGGILGMNGVATWYDNAAMVSSIGTGNNLSVPAPLTTTNYFVRIEADCDTTTAVSVKIYVLSSSTSPVSAGSDRNSICAGDGSITLTYTGGTLGDLAVARWYSDASFTIFEGEGNDLLIPGPADSTTYFVRFEGPCGNTTAVSTTVLVFASSLPPTSVVPDRDDLCPADGSINLSYIGGSLGEGAVASWYADTMAAPIGTGSSITVITPDSTTTWYVRFEGGCDSTIAVPGTVTVKALSVAPVSASADVDSICAGAGIITLSYIGGSIGDGAVAVWYDDALMTSSVATGNDVSVTSPDTITTYFVRFEGDCDTTAAASVTITVFAVPAPEFTEETQEACVNGPLYRYVVSGQQGSAYTWNITNGTIATDRNDTVFVDWGSVVQAGRLEVLETTSEGCVSIAMGIDVSISGPTVDLGEDQNICEGHSTTITPAGDYSFVFWMNNGSTGPTYTTDTTEMVRIQVFNDAGCTAFDSVQITAYPTPVVDLGNDTTLCGEASLVLDAGNPGALYFWSTGETTQTIEVFPGQQEISVEVSIAGGCSDSSSIRIRPCSPKDFFANIANTITPNEDGVNDTWQIDEAASFPEIEIEIFDRWGRLVWKSTRGYTVQWDGRSTKGEEMPMSSYFYVINLNDGSDQITGTITIMR